MITEMKENIIKDILENFFENVEEKNKPDSDKIFDLLLFGDVTLSKEFINKLSESDIIDLMKERILWIGEIPENKQNENIGLEAVKLNPLDIQHIYNQTDNICFKALERDSSSLRHIRNQKEEYCLKAVRKNGYAICHVLNQIDKIKLEAVREYGLCLEYVKNPSKEIQLEALNSDAFAIQYIDNPSEEMKLIAVKNNGLALKLIKEQTIELCIEAIRHNPWAIEYVNNDLLDYFSDIKFFKCQYRNLLCQKIDEEWLFTIGCQKQITKENFIYRIYNFEGGLEKNPHRQEYLDILNQF